MNAAQEQMLNLRHVADPGVATEHVGQPGVEVVMDPIGMGVGKSHAYMASNGPTQAIHSRASQARGRDENKMTMAQLEEQKMNEAHGLPSNLDEASRVVALEGQVNNINTNIEKLSNLLIGALNPQAVPPVALPPIRQGRPAGVPSLLGQNPSSELKNQIQSTLVAQPTQSPIPVAPSYEPVISTLEVPPQDFPEIHQVTEKDELLARLAEIDSQTEAYKVPQVSLGTVGSQPVEPDLDRHQLIEKEDLETLVEESLVEDDTPTKEDQAAQLKLERIERLSSQTAAWLSSQKVHKFWRNFLGGTCNKNLAYNTWSPTMQSQFDERFNTMVKDPIFINTFCRRILDMSMGHMVSPHVAGAFIVASAGFLSFSLIDM